MSTSSLQCLKLDPVLRKSVADILVPTLKIKVYRFGPLLERAFAYYILQEMLYVILIAQGRVITLVRPRKHSIHPSGKVTPAHNAYPRI